MPGQNCLFGDCGKCGRCNDQAAERRKQERLKSIERAYWAYQGNALRGQKPQGRK